MQGLSWMNSIETLIRLEMELTKVKKLRSLSQKRHFNSNLTKQLHAERFKMIYLSYFDGKDWK